MQIDHHVQLIIGRGQALGAFLRQWPEARAVPLFGAWRAIPVDHALFDAIATVSGMPKAHPDLPDAPPGLEAALILATREGGELAFISTDYHSGEGVECSVSCTEGKVGKPLRLPGAVNAALNAIGVERQRGRDEFASINLPQRPTMDDYAAQPAPRPEAPIGDGDEGQEVGGFISGLGKITRPRRWLPAMIFLGIIALFVWTSLL